MPELPEVETVIRVLRTLIIDKTIVDVKVFHDKIVDNLEVVDFKNKLVNQQIKSIERRGKYLVFNLSDYTLVSHLRMEGKFYFYESETEKLKHSHIIFTFSDNSQLHYNDVRKFGKMYLYKKDQDLKILEKIGLEPWDKNLTVNYLKNQIKNRRINVKAFLLDQSVIAGIGNIYVNEILFLSRLHPTTSVVDLTENDLENIIKYTQEVLSEAIKQGGTTIRSYTSSLGVTGLFQQSLYVHGRKKENCLICNSEIIKIRVAQRGTYLCPSCQRKKSE